LLSLVARLYRLPGPPAPEQFEALAEAWKPLRTWAAVLIRAAAQRLFDAEPNSFPPLAPVAG
jgi:3-methyladenine DNA glycosylase/8-oxoguanine DNA glycosylase